MKKYTKKDIAIICALFLITAVSLFLSLAAIYTAFALDGGWEDRLFVTFFGVAFFGCFLLGVKLFELV